MSKKPSTDITIEMQENGMYFHAVLEGVKYGQAYSTRNPESPLHVADEVEGLKRFIEYMKEQRRENG